MNEPVDADPKPHVNNTDTPLDVAVIEAEKVLHKPVGLVVDTRNISGSWCFLLAHLTNPDGSAFTYTGTPFTEDSKYGGISTVYAGLFHRENDSWNLVIHAVGPTDLAWHNWADKTGAPVNIFALSNK